ncbi:Oxygen-dependent choline dehydrogenase [compost metagenome]
MHGIPGLRIADASIMPTLTSGNSCSPVLVIAEKAAQMILADSARDAQVIGRPAEVAVS